jgi:death-on-curing protein
MNHPFVDGNKRTGHAAMETFLVLNGLEISASVCKLPNIAIICLCKTVKLNMAGIWENVS